MTVVSIRCDSEAADILYDQLGTDICIISGAKWQATVIASILMICIIIYMLTKWKERCHKTLLTFHNLRAAVALVLLAINTIELAKALLTPSAPHTSQPTNGVSGNGGSGITANWPLHNGDQTNGNGNESNLPLLQTDTWAAANEIDRIIIVNDTAELANALAALVMTITLMWYHRLVERKKALVFLYASSTLTVLIFILRVYELAEIVYYDSFMELESIVQCTSAACLLLLAITDGFTVYKERYRPDYFEDYEKIGYKHTLATLYSKACFWWLTPLLWLGYKEPLELEDLGQMRLEDSARSHYDRFLLIYKTAKVKNSNKPPSLWLCYFQSCWQFFALGGLLKLFGDLFAVIGPLAIQQIVQYIEHMYETHYDKWSRKSNGLTQIMGESSNSSSGSSAEGIYNIAINDTIELSSSSAIPHLSSGVDVKINYATWSEFVSNGWCIAWLVLLAAFAQGALSQASTHILNMTGIHIKTSLQGLIYRKTLLLNATCRGEEKTEFHSNKFLTTIGLATNKANEEVTPTKANEEVTPTKANEEVTPTKANESVTPTKANEEATSRLSKDNHNNDYEENKNSQNIESKDVSDEYKNDEKTTETEDLKTNTIDSTSRQEFYYDMGAITNLMSEDTLNVMSFFWIAHYVWAIPLKIGVVMYLLYLKLGISAVLGSFICILTMTPLQFLIGKAMSKNSEMTAKFTDKRLKKLHDCFVGIKLIKLNAWDNVFIKKITKARKEELKYLNKDSIYWTLMTILTHICSVLITFITLTFYVYHETGSDFTASRLFSALGLFQQLTVPLLIFPITVPIILSAIVSTRRLEKFFCAPEIQKQFEGIRHMARILSKSDASLDIYEKISESLSADLAEGKSIVKPSEKHNIKIYIPEKPAPLANSEPHTPLMLQEGKDSLVETPLDHKKLSSHARKELLRNTPYVVIRPRKNLTSLSVQQNDQNNQTPIPTPSPPPPHKHPHHHHHRNHQMQHRHSKSDSWHRDSLLLKMPDDITVSVKDCKFSWNPQKMSNFLYIRDMVIPRGQLTIIVGKNGCGKTSLLSALLMEMPLISGDMIWNKSSTIAYVPQQSWLLNASIRENILFGESFRPKRYDFVLDACALKPDIDLMPAGDLTVIGERGINISGGQRQRLAIARALYSSANVVIMDDPLSSLDNEVAHHIFELSIKKMLLKANRTVILVTHQLNLVQQAHNLIVLKNGHLQASGSYKDIAATHPHIIAKWNSIIAKANEKEQQQSVNENAALGRTARERWKLYKNVAKLSLQRSPPLTPTQMTPGTVNENGSNPMDALDGMAGVEGNATVALTNSIENILATDEEEEVYDIMPTSSLSRTPSSVYGPRHLLFDVPLPLDECQTDNVLMRKRRRTSSRGDSGGYGRQRAGSRTSSQRMSNVSNTPTELRRSIITNSCGSNVSYMTNLSSISGDESRPQSMADDKTFSVARTPDEEKPSGSCKDELQMSELKGKSSNVGKSFHEFLKRMSMRSSNKAISGRKAAEQAAGRHQCKKLLGNAEETHSFVSEESPPGIAADASIRCSDLSSVTTEMKIETEGRIASIANEESIQDAHNFDYNKTLLANNVEDTGPQAMTQLMDVSDDSSSYPVATNSLTTTTTTTTTKPILTDGSRRHVTAARTPPAMMSYDVERKYGKIPAEIYLLYLRASGWAIVLIFFITILIWQALRVYTDVWLQQWTDDNSIGIKNINKYSNHSHNNHSDHNVGVGGSDGSDIVAAAVANAVAVAAAANEYAVKSSYSHISSMLLQSFAALPPRVFSSNEQQMKFHNYARATTSDTALKWSPLQSLAVAFSPQSPPPPPSSPSPSPGGSEVATEVFAATSSIDLLHSQQTFDDDGNAPHREVTYYFHMYAVISCICVIMAMISTPAGQWAGCKARQNLHDKLLQSIMHKPLHFFQLTPLGRIMNRFSNDMAIIDKKIAATCQRLLQFTLLCLCAILINVIITPWFIAVTLPVCLAYYVIQKFFRCSSRELQRIENSTNSPIISHLSETIQGVTTIRAYNQEARFTELLFRHLEENTIAFTLLNTSNRWLGISLDYLGGVIVFVAIVTALLTATIACSSRDQQITEMTSLTNREFGPLLPSPSLVGLAINYTLLMPIYLNWVVKLLADMEMYVSSVQRIAFYAESDDCNQNRVMTAAEAEKAEATTAEVAVSATTVNTSDNVGNSKEVIECNILEKVTDLSVSKNESRSGEQCKDFNFAERVNNNGGEEFEDGGKSCALQQKQSSPHDENMTVRMETSKGDFQAEGEATKLPLLSVASEHRNSHYSENHQNAKDKKNGDKSGLRYKPVAISWPQRGDISFESVSLRYEGQQEMVISNLNLHIPAGQRIGICGRTGSGKSSLALSLFGLLQVTHGHIYIDDMDITHIHPDEVRTRLSIIPQDVHLFCMTIRENLDPSGYYSDFELWNCLELAQLKEFVNMKMPQGLDTEIMDGGLNLSVGHRQLFCLARAILRGSVCLVLDEATSALDTSTERSLLAAAHKAFQGRTIITIAHRLSTIMEYDRVIVLDKGQIIEDGDPRELRMKPNGVFAAFLKSGRPISALDNEMGIKKLA